MAGLGWIASDQLGLSEMSIEKYKQNKTKTNKQKGHLNPFTGSNAPNKS